MFATGLQKFRTGSRAAGGAFTKAEDRGQDAEAADTGLPNAVEAQEDLVEQLLEAKGDVKPDVLPRTHARSGSLLRVEVAAPLAAVTA